MAVFKRVHQQIITAPRKEVWLFLTHATHLKALTPERFRLNIKTQSLPEYFFKGMKMEYEMMLFGFISSSWISEITAYEDYHYYIDEQPKGPFKSWHHEHRLTDHPHGTLLTDTIHVEPPFGWLGIMMYHLYIKHRLDENMAYRTKALAAHFNSLVGSIS